MNMTEVGKMKKYVALYIDNKGHATNSDEINGELTLEKLYALEPKAEKKGSKYIEIYRRTARKFIKIGYYDIGKGAFYKSSVPNAGPGLY